MDQNQGQGSIPPTFNQHPPPQRRISGPGPSVPSTPVMASEDRYNPHASNHPGVDHNTNYFAGPQMSLPPALITPFAPPVALGGGVGLQGLPSGWGPSATGHFYMTNGGPFPQTAGYSQMPMMEPPIAFDPSSEPPFTDRTQFFRPRRHGVIKIKNIPYGLTMAEVHQFICKHVHPNDLIKPHEDGFPIHIIMERSTGKTMDCYVEIVNPEVAAAAYERGFGLAQCKHPKLGQRHVTVELSSMGALLKDLFPRARSVIWDDAEFGTPKPVTNSDPFSSGFKGFFTAEEMAGVVRHAEYPQRSPFAMRSFQRTYESMISSLYKFPWCEDLLYTMKQVDLLFDAYFAQLKILVSKVDPNANNPREVGLDNKLLMDFCFAGMNCPGFSERQRYAIVLAAHTVGPGLHISGHARSWPFLTLTAHPANLSDQDIAMWLGILDLGMLAMEYDLGSLNIAIDPYLQALRDQDRQIIFICTDEGKNLSRGEFSELEKHLLITMMNKGWACYMHQVGIAPPPTIPDYDEDCYQARPPLIVGRSQVDENNNTTPDDRYAAEEDDSNKSKSDGGNMQTSTSTSTTAKGKKKETNDTDRQLAAFLDLLKVTKEQDEQAAAAEDHQVGLGAGLTLGITNTPAVTRPKLSSGFDTEFSSLASKWSPPPDAILDTAFSSSGLGNGVISPPRISTARNVQGKVPHSFGFTLAPEFQVPLRTNHAVSIRAPNGTPITIPHRSPIDRATGSATQLETKTPPQVLTSVTSTALTQPTIPSTPRRTRSDNAVVTMPTIGKPSPGHTKNFGLSSTLAFGAASPRHSVSASNGMMGMVAAGAGAGANNTNPNTPSRRPRARSVFSLSETINEDDEN